MRTLPAVTTAVTVIALAVLPTAPAYAANQGVRVKALHQASVYEGYYTIVHFQYQCPIGSTAELYASIGQPGTGAFYDSTSPFEPETSLICDGEKHRDTIGLLSLGYDEAGSAPYDEPYLQDTAQGNGRGLVSVTITTSEGRTDDDTTRVTVQSRDV